MKKTILSLAITFIATATPFFATAGAVGGFRNSCTSVNAYSTDYYRIIFYGGETASILVAGDGDTDLDLYVYNEYGTLAAYDDDYTDTCLAEWFPPYTQEYDVRVVNRGSICNNYEIITN